MIRTRFLYLLFFGLLLTTAACKRSNGVVLKGQVLGLHQEDVLIYGYSSDSTEQLLRVPAIMGQFRTEVVPDSIWPIVLVFDGTLEIPVFGSPGDKVTIQGDLRDPLSFVVNGGDDINEVLTDWRKRKGKLEDFIRTYPDSPASAWLILQEAYKVQYINQLHFRKLLALLTPRISQADFLKPLSDAVNRPYSKSLDLPFFGKAARVILRTGIDEEKLDSTFTYEQLTNRLGDALAK
ncbi:MAG: hypothetical protein WCQ86_00230 [Bacteroidaceae bacterium]